MRAGPELAIRLAPLPPPVAMPVESGAPEIAIEPRLLGRIEEQAETNRHREVGGLLVGRAVVAGARVRLEVTGALPAERIESGPAHLTFTHETWSLLRHRRHAEHAGDLVVGWYHTHPGLGVFLSGLDLWLHARIFAEQPWCVALVLDPVRRRRAFFWPRGDEVHRCPEIVGRGGDTRAAAGGRSDGIPDVEDRH